jgi:quinol monooxygenase YgiN
MEASTTITVVARWRVREDHLDDVLAHVAELRIASLAEPGCLEYAAFRSIDAADELLLVERYRDVAALEAHRQSPHYGALVVERILPLLADRHVELLQLCLPLPHHR